MKKERILSLDFVRVICTWGIIANHFAKATGDRLLTSVLYTHPNGSGSVGYTLVTVFFILSGAVLYYSSGRPVSLKQFYTKRWKAVFPSYYITYIMMIAFYAVANRVFFTDRNPLMLVWTVLGCDGYLNSALPTWYIIGEWFTGAILLCYLFYPLIAYCTEKNETVTCLALLGLYILTLNRDMLNQNAFRNPFSCLLSFSWGIILIKHGWFRIRKAGAVSLLLLLLFVFLPLKADAGITAHIEGLLLFMVLAALGRYTMNNRFFSAVIQGYARISFEVFLVHHVIIVYVLYFLHPESVFLQLPVLLVAMILSTIGGYAVWWIRKQIFKWCQVIGRQKKP